jgi:hypothetical protein
MTIFRRLRVQWIFLLLSLVTVSAAKDSPTNKYLLFVGTYTEKESKGIYAYRFDATTSELTPAGCSGRNHQSIIPRDRPEQPLPVCGE